MHRERPRETRFPGFRVTVARRKIALAEFTPPGATFSYELAARPPGVRVIGLTEDRTRVWLTDEYRIEQGSRDVRLPGGKVADSLGTYLEDVAAGWAVGEDEILDAARREFREEVGLELLEPQLITMSACGAMILWDLHYVAGICAGDAPEQALEAGEDIRPMLVNVDEAYELARRSMAEERSALHLMRFLDRLREE